MPTEKPNSFAMVWKALLLVSLGATPLIAGLGSQPSDASNDSLSEALVVIAGRMQEEVETLRG